MAARAVGPLHAQAERQVDVRRRIGQLRRSRGEPVLPVARSLVGTGLAGAGIAATFEAAAAEALPEQPVLAGQLFAAAVQAGRRVPEVGAGWARRPPSPVTLISALRLADAVVAAHRVARPPRRRAGGGDRAGAPGTTGPQRRVGRRWAGGPSAVFAAIGLIGTGQLGRGRALLDAPPGDGPPTLLAGAPR